MKAEDKIAIQKGVQIKIWPMVMLQSDNSKPIWIITTSKETPIMISGSTIGSITKPIIDRRPKKENRVEARAASTASSVENIAVVIAISKLLRAATCRVPLVSNTENHSVVNPESGNETILLVLKAKTGNKIAGPYKNNKNKPMNHLKKPILPRINLGP
jgi:hypothetical protein|tara:strand:+ start:149 stop:625 length:477 start_codon:yes stop_codon:yes gene_type:complete